MGRPPLYSCNTRIYQLWLTEMMCQKHIKMFQAQTHLIIFHVWNHHKRKSKVSYKNSHKVIHSGECPTDGDASATKCKRVVHHGPNLFSETVRVFMLARFSLKKYAPTFSCVRSQQWLRRHMSNFTEDICSPGHLPKNYWETLANSKLATPTKYHCIRM